MNRDELYILLAEFFHDSFREDPVGVGDWFAQGDHDIEQFIAELDRAHPRKAL